MFLGLCFLSYMVSCFTENITQAHPGTIGSVRGAPPECAQVARDLGGALVYFEGQSLTLSHRLSSSCRR